MTATFEAIGLGHLSPPERQDFVNQLKADVGFVATSAASEEKLAYIRRLQAEARANPDDRIPWDEVYNQLLKEFPE